MTEEEARSWIADRFGTQRLAKLERYASVLLLANQTQNLISKATESHIWVRHILDSAQLQRFAPAAETWLDIGSGAGLPGIVLAVLTGQPTLLVEPRRKRVEFLQQVIDELQITNGRVRQAAVERLDEGRFAAVTARAYAPLPALFTSAIRLTDLSTTWVLPKGRNAERELEAVRDSWQGVFHVEQSLTDENARIIVATGLRSR